MTEQKDRERIDNESNRRESVVTEQDVVNKALLHFQQFKQANTNPCPVRAIYLLAASELKNDDTLYDNVAQLGFIRLVMEQSDDPNRFRPSPGAGKIGDYSALPAFMPLLATTFDQFIQDTYIGDSSKKADYLSILAKFNNLKAKKKLAENPFSEQLTESEKKFMEKFLARVSAVRISHDPNENAVAYAYLLARMFIIMVKVGKITKAKNASMNDILKFFAVHGQKSTAEFIRIVTGFVTIMGPEGKHDIKPTLVALIAVMRVGNGGNDDKNLNNNELSLRRIIRIVHIFTNHPTPWGVLTMNIPYKQKSKQIMTCGIARNNLQPRVQSR